MQRRIMTPGPLHDEKGHLIETGYATELLKTYDRSKVAASRLKVKEWDYYAICTDRFTLALTIDHNGYMTMDSISLLDFERNTQITKSAMSLPFLSPRELPAEPEFDPVEGYDVFTTVEYTIEDLGEDMVCTVCKKADGSEYDIQCNFFGDDQEWSGTYADGAVETISDKTGFMEGDAPKIIDIAEEQNIWLPIE